jgi:hypothetical protein
MKDKYYEVVPYLVFCNFPLFLLLCPNISLDTLFSATLIHALLFSGGRGEEGEGETAFPSHTNNR